jgi:hypothetical protein
MYISLEMIDTVRNPGTHGIIYLSPVFVGNFACVTGNILFYREVVNPVFGMIVVIQVESKNAGFLAYCRMHNGYFRPVGTNI